MNDSSRTIRSSQRKKYPNLPCHKFMQTYIDQFTVLKKLGFDSNPNRGFRALQRCAILGATCRLKDLMPSDILSMTEVFLSWSYLGYRCALTAAIPVWSVISLELSRSHDSDSQTMSDVSMSGLKRGIDSERIARIRAEALRCLNQILRSQPEVFLGHWISLVFGDTRRPGLKLVAKSDPGAFARRFALSCMVSLVSCDRVRKWVGPFSARSSGRSLISLTEDIGRTIPDVAESVLNALECGNIADNESALYILSEFVGCIPWKSLTDKGEAALHRIVKASCMFVMHESLEVSCHSIAGIAAAIPHVSLSDVDQCALVSKISAIMLARPLEIHTPCQRAFILQVNLLIHRLSGAIDSTFVEETVTLGLKVCEHSIQDSSNLNKQAQALVSSCLVNIRLLRHLKIETCEVIMRISRRISELPPELNESFQLGLGKLSRYSPESLKFVLTLPLVTDRVTGRGIQAVSDVLFSCLVYHVEDIRTVEIWRFVNMWLMDENLRQASFRALMTGISRLNERLETAVLHTMTHVVTVDIQVWLMAFWSTNVCEDKFMADSIRMIGLLQSLIRQGNAFAESFIEVSETRIAEALHSRHTQTVLSGIFSLKEMGKCSIFDKYDQLKTVIIEHCTTISERETWDYDSAAAIGGSLHVILDALMEYARDGASVETRVALALKNLKDDKRIRGLSRFNPNIIQYLNTISQLEFLAG